MLSCECDWYPEPGDVTFWPPRDYSTLETSRRKRCESCNCLIDIGSLVGKFQRYKMPDSDVEIRIYGDGEDGEEGVPRADHYLCEPCMDLYYSLEELGFCPQLGDQRELAKEYARDYGPASKGVSGAGA
jgi:hypothetical protein